MTIFFQTFKKINHHLKLNPDFAVELKFEDYDKFDCSGCGECCKKPWRVPLKKSYVDEWEEVFDSHPSGRFKKPFVLFPNPTNDSYANMRRKEDSNECIFLDDDNLCFIHKNYGLNALSFICRDYPKWKLNIGQKLVISHLLASCRDIPELWFNEPEFSYVFIDGRNLSNQNIQLSLFGETYLNVYGFMIWLAIALDTVIKFESPIKGFKYFLNVLPSFLRSTNIHISEELITRIYHQHQSWLKQDRIIISNSSEKLKIIRLVHRLCDCNESLKEFLPFLDDIMEGRERIPHLTNSEKTILRQFLKSYLFRKLVAPQFAIVGTFNLIEEMIMLGFCMTTIQLFSLYYKQELDVPFKECIGMAVEKTEFYLVHNQDWLKNASGKDLSLVDYIKSTSIFVSIDVT